MTDAATIATTCHSSVVVPFLALVILCSSFAAPVDAADELPPGIVLEHNIRYREGASKSWMLDLAKPSAPSKKPRPAIVVIHGGGWIEGDKSSFSTPGQPTPGNIIDFAKLGFVAVTINYRLAKEEPYPAAVVDCQCAVRWLRAHAKEHNVDPDRIGAYGNSAGGHLALMLAIPKDELKIESAGEWQEFSNQVQAAVSDSGPLDLEYQFKVNALRTVVSQFMGGAPDGNRTTRYWNASPSRHFHNPTVPLLLIYGADDAQVPVVTADTFVASLSTAGLKDLSYHRLAAVDHCPHSIQRVQWLVPVVNEFFARTLKLEPSK